MRGEKREFKKKGRGEIGVAPQKVYVWFSTILVWNRVLLPRKLRESDMNVSVSIQFQTNTKEREIRELNMDFKRSFLLQAF